jgi:hypothetical protein
MSWPEGRTKLDHSGLTVNRFEKVDELLAGQCFICSLFNDGLLVRLYCVK